MDLDDYRVELSDDMRKTLDRLLQPVAVSDAMREALDAVGSLSRSIGQTTSSLFSEQFEILGKTATDAAQTALKAVAVPSALQTLMDEMTQRTESAAKLLPDFPERPQPVIHDLPSLTPIPQRKTPAAESIETIVEMWEQRRREMHGSNQEAFVKVTPPDGRAILVQSLAAQGENLIVIQGHVADGEEVSITVGATAFQVEVIALDKPPTKPDLRIVE